MIVLLLPPLAAADSVRVTAAPDVIDDYHRLLAGRSVSGLTRYTGPGSRRDVVELVLVQQALALGGEHRAIELVPAPTYRRMLALVADGHAQITGSSVWSSDIDAMAARLQASTPLVADGEFIAGLFRAPKAVAVDEQVRAGHWGKLTAVSSSTWVPDWLALNKLGLATVYDVAEWPAMVRMVNAGRTDLLLAPFQPGNDGPLHHDGMTLVPVAGVCLPLAGSRHIAVTRNADGDGLLAALERGLARLRHDNTIRRAYTEAGFLTASQRACQPPLRPR